MAAKARYGQAYRLPFADGFVPGQAAANRDPTAEHFGVRDAVQQAKHLRRRNDMAVDVSYDGFGPNEDEQAHG